MWVTESVRTVTSERSITPCLAFLGLSFLLALSSGQEGGWHLRSETGSEVLAANLLAAGPAQPLYPLPTFPANAASQCGNRDLCSPLRSPGTAQADSNLHSPSFMQTTSSLQSEENNKSSLERCHSWLLQKDCWKELDCACQELPRH